MTSLVALPTAVRLKITLHVYSGRPDPFWFIPAEAAQELMERIGKISNSINIRPPTVQGLGYRGFSISNIESQIGWYVHQGMVDLGMAAQTLMAGSRDIEQWLLDVGGSIINSAVQSHVAESLSKPTFARSLGSGGSGCPKCVAADAPPLNLSKWNTPAVQPNNNCYNYANDRITNNFSQPGDATGKAITGMSCAGVQPSAVSDGLVATSNFSSPLAAKKGFYVALVIWPGNDFHWYRQDSSGCWSHKPGQTAARATDNKGAAITDPNMCDRGPYKDSCAYMITKSSVKIA